MAKSRTAIRKKLETVLDKMESVAADLAVMRSASELASKKTFYAEAEAAANALHDQLKKFYNLIARNAEAEEPSED